MIYEQVEVLTNEDVSGMVNQDKFIAQVNTRARALDAHRIEFSGMVRAFIFYKDEHAFGEN